MLLFCVSYKMIVDKINEVLNNKLIRNSSEIIICLNKKDFEEIRLIKNVFWTCKAKLGDYLIWKFDLENITEIFIASETCPEDKIFVYKE